MNKDNNISLVTCNKKRNLDQKIIIYIHYHGFFPSTFHGVINVAAVMNFNIALLLIEINLKNWTISSSHMS